MSPRRLLLSLLFATAGLLRADPASVLERATLLDFLSSDLAGHYAVTDKLAVDLIRPWTPPAAAEGETPLVITVVEYPEALAPSMLVRVRYTREKNIVKEDTLALRVNLWRDALFAATPLKRGDSFSLDGTEIRRVDALRDRDALPSSLATNDYVLAREVPAGRALTWRDVARRSLVHRGQVVEVLASDGALVITMKALAMQDGAQGESVRVRNIESKREFIAKVTAENRAEVRF